MKINQILNELLKQATKSYSSEEIPIGCLVTTADNMILSRGHNQTEQLNDSTAHAEIIALTSAMGNLQSKYLFNCNIYISVKPCLMCLGAIYHSKIKDIYYLLENPKEKYSNDLPKQYNLNLKKIENKEYEQEFLKLMQNFFQTKRGFK